jgi:uncharacterized protein YggT (Ycf19 family)
MERRDTEIERDPVTGNVHEHRSVTTDDAAVPAESEVISTFNPAWRAVQAVYLVFGILVGLIAIRIVLKLMGANPQAPFASWLYSVTDVFLSPFHNLLPTIGNAQSQLEMSAVVAILVYALIAWAVAQLVRLIFYRNVTVARRSGRLRPRGY